MKIHEIVTEKAGLIKGIAQKVGQVVSKGQAAKAAAGSAVKTTAQAGFALTSAALSFLKAYQLYLPYKAYSTTMAKRDDQVKRGVLTQVQYEIVREQELTKLIVQWTAILATNGLLRSGVMPFLAGVKLFGMGSVYTFINSLTKGAQLWLMNWWNSEEGRKWVASILAHGVINNEDMISPIIGGNVAELIDQVKGKMRREKVDTAQPASAPSTQTAEPTAVEPEDTGFEKFAKDIPAADKSREIKIDPYTGSWTNR